MFKPVKCYDTMALQECGNISQINGLFSRDTNYWINQLIIQNIMVSHYAYGIRLSFQTLIINLSVGHRLESIAWNLTQYLLVFLLEG